MLDLSIIIPAYNVGSKIEVTLDSIFAQKTDYSYEVICIAGPSTDNTKDVLHNYKKNHDNLLIVDYAYKNLLGARELGIKSSNGKYILFCDGDDRHTETAINTLINAIQKTDADVVHASFFFEKKKSTKQTVYRKNATLTDTEYIKLLLKDVYVRSYLWCKIFKREVLTNINFHVPEKNIYREDTYFNFLTIKNIKKAATIKEPVYYYNKKEESIFSGVSKDRVITFIKIFGFERWNIERAHNEEALKFFKKMRFWRWMQLEFDQIYNKRAFNKEEYKEFKKNKRKWLKILRQGDTLLLEGMPWLDLIKPYME